MTKENSLIIEVKGKDNKQTEEGSEVIKDILNTCGKLLNEKVTTEMVAWSDDDEPNIIYVQKGKEEEFCKQLQDREKYTINIVDDLEKTKNNIMEKEND